MNTIKEPQAIVRIEIIQDTDCESPRNWDNIGTMVSRQVLDGDISGDESVDDEAMQELIVRCQEESLVFTPFYALIHSGVWLSTTKSFNGYTCQWDTSFAGLVYVENEKMIEEYGDLSLESKAKALGCLEGEVEVYGQFLQGDVYGFHAYNSDGEEVDSCWGFYGSDPMENGMAEHIESEFHELLKVAEIVYPQ